MAVNFCKNARGAGALSGMAKSGREDAASEVYVTILLLKAQPLRMSVMASDA